MFKCDDCKRTIGPRVSPIIVAEQRTRTYAFKREVELIGEVEDVAIGTEIVREFRLCAKCAGVTIPEPNDYTSPVPTTISEVLAPPARFRIVTLAAEGMYERTKHQTKRAGADFLAAFKVLKPYAQLVGAIE